MCLFHVSGSAVPESDNYARGYFSSLLVCVEMGISSRNHPRVRVINFAGSEPSWDALAMIQVLARPNRVGLGSNMPARTRPAGLVVFSIRFPGHGTGAGANAEFRAGAPSSTSRP